MRAALSTRRVSCRSAFSRQRSQCACARHNEAVLRGNNVVKLVPAESVLQLTADDRFRLTAAQFEELSTAFFAEIAREFLSPRGDVRARETPGVTGVTGLPFRSVERHDGQLPERRR